MFMTLLNKGRLNDVDLFILIFIMIVIQYPYRRRIFDFKIKRSRRHKKFENHYTRLTYIL